MLDSKDIADYAVDYGINQGASFVEARLMKIFEENYTARNGRFLGLIDNTLKGLGVRILVQGGLAFGSTVQFKKRDIENLLQSTIKLAKLTSRKTPIELSDEKIIEDKWETKVAINFKDVSKQEKQNYIKNLDKRLKNESQGDIKSRIIFTLLKEEEKYIINSEGSNISSKNSLISMMVMSTAKGENGTEQRTLNLGGTAGWEWFERNNISQKVVEDGKALVKAASSAKSIKFENPIDVVVNGEVAGIMAHENVGHPSEGDRILGREGAQAGESFYADLLKEGNLGDISLGNDIINIIDDPTIPASPGYYLYDDECVKARKRYLIKNGKLNELLLNREYAARFNTHSNAAARAFSYNREPLTRMSNTFFEPGSYSVDELIEGVKYGILMKSFTEWNIDDRRFQSKYVGLETYLIENGELTDIMVKRPVLELTTRGILSNIDAVGKDYFAPLGICGKGDPMQGVPVSLGGPHIRLRNITVGGDLK